jgi:uncharacterized protein (TIGR03382 family)
VPYSDFLLAGTTPFDGTALPGSSEPIVSVTSPPTSPITLISVAQLTADLIDIVGISGGLSVTVQGDMTTTYTTTSITIGTGSIANDDQSLSVATPSAGFGPSLALPISATGVVQYEPSLIFAARFGVSILGISIASWELASISLPLPTIDRNVTLTAAQLEIPLPHLDTVPSSVGFASGASQTLSLHNTGEAPLVIEVASAPEGIEASAQTIAPGSDGTVQVSAADPATVQGVLVLATNDPNHPQVSIALDGSQTGSGSEDPPIEHAGCNATTGSTGTSAIVIALAALIGRRRRRRGPS